MPLSDVNEHNALATETENVISLDERRQTYLQSRLDELRLSEGISPLDQVTAPLTVPVASAITAVFLEQMKFKASVEIDDLVWVRGHFSSRVRDQIVAAVRKLLCREFGRNMVHRDGLVFIVCHRRVETLIAGLLRVQFYANQILLPEFNIFGERVDQNGVGVTWGVGRSPQEADLERVKKRKRRNLRRY